VSETLYSTVAAAHARLTAGMSDLQLVFFQYVGKTPSLAGCTKCHLKFLTPQPLMRQPEAAAQYLREKFARHTCKWEISEETRPEARQTRRLRIIKPSDDTSPVGMCEVCNMRFPAPVYLRAHPQQAENEIRQQFGRHRCRRREAS
jgi:hypothetical protein